MTSRIRIRCAHAARLYPTEDPGTLTSCTRIRCYSRGETTGGKIDNLEGSSDPPHMVFRSPLSPRDQIF